MREIFAESNLCYGHKTETAVNGLEAVEKALEKNFDLILMDIQMPVMTGFEALEILKLKQYQGPIVAITAHSITADKERCLAAGFDNYFSKPIDFKAFKELLDQLSARLHKHKSVISELGLS